MKKIVLRSSEEERDRAFIACLKALFPEVEIEIISTEGISHTLNEGALDTPRVPMLLTGKDSFEKKKRNSESQFGF